MKKKQDSVGSFQLKALNEKHPVQEKLESIPKRPGVYIYRDKNHRVIYVGKAKVLANRVRSYFQYSADRPPKLKILQRTIFDVEFFITDSEKEALILENNLIKKYQPRFNVRLKDDKTYPYIRITNEAFPQVFMTRNLVQDGSKYIGPYTNVYDVKLALQTLQKYFQVRTCTFPLTEESIKKKKYRVCLDYHIKRCAGPCEGLQSETDYKQIIKNVDRFLLGQASDLKIDLEEQMATAAKSLRYEDAAKIRDTLAAVEVFYKKKQKVEKIEKLAQDFLGVVRDDKDVCACILKVREGKVLGKQEFMLVNEFYDEDEVIFENFLHSFYTEQMLVADELYIPEGFSNDLDMHQDFLRDATQSKIKLFQAKIGDKAKLIRLARLNAQQKLDEVRLNRLKKDFIPQGLKSLKRDLNLKTIPKRIECFDNSNMQGTDAVSSMVVFINGKPAKSEYRKYKTKSLENGVADDFATMYEVVFRRYKRLRDEKKPFPDLIMVDGGKGQLSSAVLALRDLGVFPHPIIGIAKRLEEIFIPDSPDPQNIPRTSSAIKILQQLRDESHRFAITFHRERRKKRTLTSVLDDIEGIGETRRKQILKHFGSLKKVKEANLAELNKMPRMPTALAERIYKTFREDV
jgi:excinuclease ABC subunit C